MTSSQTQALREQIARIVRRHCCRRDNGLDLSEFTSLEIADAILALHQQHPAPSSVTADERGAQIDAIAREITEEVKIEMAAEDRVRSAGDTIAPGGDLHTIKSLLDAIHQLRAALTAHDRRAPVEDLNFIKSFWRAQPSCLHLKCDANCNPMTTHCGRAAEVFAEHNASLVADDRGEKS